MAYDFSSPGGDATTAIQNYLVQQAQLQHQALIDSLAQKRESDDSAIRKQQLAINAANLATLTDERTAAAEARKNELAGKVASILTPGSAVSPDTSATLNAGHLGSLVNPGVTIPRVDLTSAPATDTGSVPGVMDAIKSIETGSGPADLAAQETPDSTPADARSATFKGTPQQQSAAEEKAARLQILNDPSTSPYMKSVLALPGVTNADIIKAKNDELNNNTKSQIEQARNEARQHLEDIRDQFRGQLTGLQSQLLQAKIDALNSKATPPSVGIDSDTKYTAGGTPYVDLSKYKGKDYSTAQQEAKANGVFGASAAEADALDQINTARKNMALINESIDKLPTHSMLNPIGLVQAATNKVEAATGYDADLATFKTNTDAAVQAMKAVAGTKGLRLNKDLIKASLDNNTPSITDPQDVARDKYKKFMQFLDNQEKTILGQSGSASSTPAAVSSKYKVSVQ
jgi:hypothetical protein